MISLKDNNQPQDGADGEGQVRERGVVLRKAAAWQDRWWQTHDGLRLYARDYPAAPGRVRLPVICLHGLTRNSADFEEVAPYIAALDRRVIVPDLRGRGLSQYDPDSSNYHAWTYAKDVLDLCDNLGIGRAIFIGASAGGVVTMVLSTLRPTLIRSAILNDTGPSIPPKALARIAGLAAAKPVAFKNWHDASMFIAEQNRRAFPNYAPADWLKFARRVCLKGRDGLLRPAFDPRITEAFRSGTLTASTYDLEPCYDSLAHGRKLLVVRGALSDVLEAREAKRMVAAGPDVTCVEIPHTGHAPVLSEPVAQAAVTEFLEAQP